ncbi:MAG: sigma-70 family RNA polymerase sigma factor [Clostridiales bacterium]|nr:sigma-70 family RNA polymerase sigma factor [Clostridiales bacterium]
MSKNNFSIQFINDKNLPALDKEKNTELLLLACKGDKQAREKCIYSNIRLVINIINKFKNDNEDIDDLFQIGCVGLTRAVDNFNPNFGVKFSTYAVPLIMGEIKRDRRDNCHMKISRNMRNIYYKLVNTKRKLYNKNFCEPTFDEIVSTLEIDKTKVVQAYKSALDPVSLDFNSVENYTKFEEVNFKSQNKTDAIALQSLIKKLPESKKKIIIMRFFKDMTQVEVAKRLKISQAQVSRIEKSTIKYFGQELLDNKNATSILK